MRAGDLPIGVVTIGRNEGERLQRCLRSLHGKVTRIVYVDSGSSDGSADFARSLGVEVVELDMSKPFSMARGRNAGFQRLLELDPDLPLVQFVDGDCEVAEGWLKTAAAYLEAHPACTVVCGRRQERFPRASVYNLLCDIEWNTPVGVAKACGGDALMRVPPLREAEGFNESLIAYEEPDLCLRLRLAGGEIHRIDALMTLHDANIHHFRAWWRRTLRSGYGAMDLRHKWAGKIAADQLPGHHLLQSAPRWSVMWLAATCALALLWRPLLLLGFLAWTVQALKIAKDVRSRAPNPAAALAYGGFTMIGKWAQLLGMLQHRRDRRNGKLITLIEYK